VPKSLVVNGTGRIGIHLTNRGSLTEQLLNIYLKNQILKMFKNIISIYINDGNP
jgi:hypothetical protein